MNVLVKIYCCWVLTFPLFGQNSSKKEGNQIFIEKCLSCHRPNGNAPFQLTSYKQIARFKSMIEYVVKQGIMPPWRPDNTYNQYKHNRALEQKEKEILLDWVKNLQKNDPLLSWEDFYSKKEDKKQSQYIDLQYPSGLDVVVNIKDTTLVFEFPYQLDSKKNVNQIEFYCSNMSIIHHVNYFVMDSAKAAGKQATVMNENFLSNNDIALGYAPGNQQLPFEKGYGFILPPKGKIVGDIHLSPANKNETLQFGFKFHYSDAPIEHILFLQVPPNLTKVDYTKLELQPNEIRTFKAYYTLSEDIKILYTHPHLHVFGKSFLSYAISPENDTIPIIKIDKWKFYEQEYYELKEPLILQKGTKIFYEATYDNTSENPMNPFSPPIYITEGWSTNQEMMMNLLICTYLKK